MRFDGTIRLPTAGGSRQDCQILLASSAAPFGCLVAYRTFDTGLLLTWLFRRSLARTTSCTVDTSTMLCRYYLHLRSRVGAVHFFFRPSTRRWLNVYSQDFRISVISCGACFCFESGYRTSGISRFRLPL